MYRRADQLLGHAAGDSGLGAIIGAASGVILGSIVGDAVDYAEAVDHDYEYHDDLYYDDDVYDEDDRHHQNDGQNEPLGFHLLRHRVDAAGPERMAPEQATAGEPGALERAVPAKRLDGILRTGRGVAARRWEKRGDHDLVETNKSYQEPPGHI